MAAVQTIRKNLRLEKKEYKYILREFPELKRIYSSIQEIERVKRLDAPDGFIHYTQV